MALNRRTSQKANDQIILAAEKITPLEISEEWRAELLDLDAWGPILETFAVTTKLAVALTDRQGLCWESATIRKRYGVWS